MTNAMITAAAIQILSMATNDLPGKIHLSDDGSVMTYPRETVEVVTNVTRWDNEEKATSGNFLVGGITTIDCQSSMSWTNWGPPFFCPKPATQKTETTTVIERRVLRFDWNGQPQALTQEKVLSEKVRRWKRAENWEEEP